MALTNSLDELLEQASKTNNVPLILLKKILQEERLRLYLFASSRSSVLDTIRKIIQDEVK